MNDRIRMWYGRALGQIKLPSDIEELHEKICGYYRRMGYSQSLEDVNIVAIVCLLHDLIRPQKEIVEGKTAYTSPEPVKKRGPGRPRKTPVSEEVLNGC